MDAAVKIFEVERGKGTTRAVHRGPLKGVDREDLRAKAVKKAQALGLVVRACSWEAQTDPEQEPSLIVYGTRGAVEPVKIPGWRYKLPPQ